MSDLDTYLNRSVESFFGLTPGMRRILNEANVQTVKDLLSFNLSDITNSSKRSALQAFKDMRLEETERFRVQEVAVTKLPSIPKDKKTNRPKEKKAASSENHKTKSSSSFFVGGAWEGGLYPSVDFEFDPIHVPWVDLLRHTFICGGTGSGKTVLAKSLLEQAAVNDIPSVVIDPAGDYACLALAEAIHDDQALKKFSKQYAKDYGPDNSSEKSTKYWMNQFLEDQQQNNISSVSLSEIKNYKKKVFVRIFTPGSSRLGNSLALPPIDGQLLKQDPAEETEEYLQRVDEIVLSMVKTLGTTARHQDRFATFIREIIIAGNNSGDFDGRDGDRFLERLNQLIPQYCEILRDIGGVPIDDYITTNEVNGLARDLATYRMGTKAAWLKGIPFDLDTLTKKTGGRVPINIISIQHLEPSEQQDAVARIASKIGRWMFGGQSGLSDRPRLLFSLDELGGGGNTEAIFPSGTANPISKPPLLRLIRQGRKYGIGLVLATQNVKDIDYKGLGNVNSWFVGKLTQQREFRIVQDALTNSVNVGNVTRNHINSIMSGLKEGMFLYVGSGGEGTRLKARWIKSLHLTPSQELQEKLVSKQRQAVEQHVNSMVFSEGPFKPNLEFSLFGNYHECLLKRLLKIKEIKLGEFEAYKWLVEVAKSVDAIGNLLTIIKKIKLEKIKSIREWLLYNKNFDKKVIEDALECLAAESLKNGFHEEAAETIKTEQNPQRKKIILNFIERIAKWNLFGEKINDWTSIGDQTLIKVKENSFIVDPYDPAKGKNLIESVKTNIHKEIRDKDQNELSQWLEEIKKKRGEETETKASKDHSAGELVDQRTLMEQVIKNIREGEKIDIKKLGLLAKSIEDIDPYDFEFFVAKILSKRGYQTELTKAVGDDGVDVLAYDKSQRRIAIQCKRQKKSVGPGIIREMQGAQKLNHCDASVVVTTSRFTDAAQRTANELNIGLIDGDDIIQILI